MQTAPLPAIETGIRFPASRYALLLFLIAVLSVAPFASILIADSVAGRHDCTLNEGGAHPCIIGGVDLGGMLALMFVFGWWMFATIPIGAVAFSLCLIALVFHRIRWKRQRLAHDGTGAGAPQPRTARS